MKKISILSIMFALFMSNSLVLAASSNDTKVRKPVSTNKIKLPATEAEGNISLEQILEKRGKKVHSTTKNLTFFEVSQLLWAGYGYNNIDNKIRTVTSQDDAYSLSLYLATNNNIYRYLPVENAVEKIAESDIRKKLSDAAKKDADIYKSTFNIIITGSVKMAGCKIPRNANQYMLVEAGRVCQNIELQAVSMGLAVKSTLDFDAKKIRSLLKLNGSSEPIAIVTINKTISRNAYEFKQIKVNEKNAQPAAKLPKRVAVIIPDRRVIEKEYSNIVSTLRLVGISVDVACSTLNEVRGDRGNIIRPNMLIRDLRSSDYDGIVLIGGTTGKKQYKDESLVARIVRDFYNDGDVIGALGRTPELLAMAGIVRNIRVTSDLSQRRELKRAGAIWIDSPIEVSDKIITAKGYVSGGGISSGDGLSGVNRFAGDYVMVIQGKDVPDRDYERNERRSLRRPLRTESFN